MPDLRDVLDSGTSLAELADAAEAAGPLPEPGAEDLTAELEARAPSLGSLVGPAVERMERRVTGTEIPLSVPWEGLSEALGGGLWPGLYVLVGNTGSGKSQWALQLALHAARSGCPALYIGLELDYLGLVARLLGLRAGEEGMAGRMWSGLWKGRPFYQGGTDPVTGRLATLHALRDRFGPELAALPFRMEAGADAGPYGWPYTELSRRSRAFRAEHLETLGPVGMARRPFLVVLDFLQIVGSPADTARQELRERIALANYHGRQVARELDAVVLLLSSTARANYTDMAPKKDGKGFGSGSPRRFIGMGKESGEIEYGGDGVFVLGRSGEREGNKTPMALGVAKQRAGGDKWVPLTFDGSRFEDGGELALAPEGYTAEPVPPKRKRKKGGKK